MIRCIINGVFSRLLMTIVSMAGSIYLTAIIVHKLSVMDAGIWFTYYGLTIFFSFCDFGCSPALGREIALASYKKNLKIRINNLYSTVNKVMYLFVSIGAVVSVLFYFFVLKEQSAADPKVFSSYILFCIGIGFRLLANPPLAVIYGLRKVALQNTLLTLSIVLFVMLSIFSLNLRYGLIGLSVAYLLTNLLLYLSSTFYVVYRLNYSSKLRFSRHVLARIAHVAMNWSLMNIGAIMVLQLPGFIIVKELGPAALTPFAIIRQLCSVILTFSIVLGDVTMPFISQEAGAGNKSVVRTMFVHVVKYSSLAALLSGVYIYSMQHQIETVWLGNPNMFSHNVLLIMLVGIILEAHHVSVTKVCLSAGYVQFAKIGLFAGILATILSYIFIIKYGVIGAAIAIVISQLLTNNWFVIYISLKYLKVNLKQYLSILMQLLIILIVSLSAEYCLFIIIKLKSIYYLLGINAIVLGSLTFCTLLMFREERDLINKFLFKLKSMDVMNRKNWFSLDLPPAA